MAVKNRGRLPAVLAIITLAVAYVAPLLVSTAPDHLFAFQALFPDAVSFTRRSGDPPVYQALGGGGPEAPLLGYIALGTAVGYEGPILTAVACDPEGRITGIAILEHTEWMTWYHKVEKAGFMDGFIDRRVSDPLTLGLDLDGVTSATFTTRGIADGVRQAAHAVAVGELGLPVASAGRDLRLTAEVWTVLALWAVVLTGVLTKRARLRWVTLTASLAVLGFWLAAPVSFSSLAGLLLGRLPPLETAHLVWYALLAGILLTAIFLGRNLYCYWMCPFGALQELLTLAGGGGLTSSVRFRRLLRAVRPLLVWGALAITFLTRSAAAASYEPFGTLFTFTGSDLRWTFLIFVLVVGLFSARFFCLHFCPVGYIIDLIVSGRRTVRGWLRTAGFI